MPAKLEFRQVAGREKPRVQLPVAVPGEHDEAALNAGVAAAEGPEAERRRRRPLSQVHAVDQRCQQPLRRVDHLPIAPQPLEGLSLVAGAPEEPPDVLVLLRRERAGILSVVAGNCAIHLGR